MCRMRVPCVVLLRFFFFFSLVGRHIISLCPLPSVFLCVLGMGVNLFALTVWFQPFFGQEWLVSSLFMANCDCFSFMGMVECQHTHTHTHWLQQHIEVKVLWNNEHRTKNIVCSKCHPCSLHHIIRHCKRHESNQRMENLTTIHNCVVHS